MDRGGRRKFERGEGSKHKETRGGGELEEAYRIRREKEARGTRRERPCRKEMDDVLGASMSATGPEKDSPSKANAPEWGSLSRDEGNQLVKARPLGWVCDHDGFDPL